MPHDSSRQDRRTSSGGRLTRRFAPPDPRPGRADPEQRSARQNLEKESGFGWEEVLILGVTAATALLSFDKAYEKHVQRSQQKEKEEAAQNDRARERRRREGDRSRRRGVSEDNRSRTYDGEDDWSDYDRDDGYDRSARARGRSRGYGRDDYDRYPDRAYPRGYSVDYHRDRNGPRRETTW